MIDRANGGDFVILAHSGDPTALAKKIWNDLGGQGLLHSVEGLVVDSATIANEPAIQAAISGAEAIYIEGGDQAQYIEDWGPIASALQSRVGSAVLGGGSAGLAILGDPDYSATNGTVTSAQALADPFDTRMAGLSTALLSGTFGAIADTHFDEWDRMGRLLAFVARVVTDGLGAGHGVGVSAGTAVLYSLTGGVADWGGMDSKIVGTSSAYFVSLLGVTTCEVASPLDASFRVRRFRAGTTFNFADGWLDDPSMYVLTATNGAVTSTQTDNTIY